MLAIRVIPALLIKNGGLVKGARFRNHNYVGDPVNAVRIFNQKGVDELVFLDIGEDTALKGPQFNHISDIASQAFMPLAYGGGLRTEKDIEKLLRLGIEKAVINTAAMKDFSFIRRAADIAGSQSIVVSIDVKKNLLGKYSIISNSSQLNTKMNPVEAAKRSEEAGAGEILLSSIDREGTGEGYDLELIKSVSESISIPVIASGGASSLEHFRQAVEKGASAVAAGNMFVFHGKRKAVLITYPPYEELEKTFKNLKRE